MTIEEFKIEIEKLGISINRDQLEKLDQLYLLMIEWNKKINLTRIIEKEEVYLKHFYDSLSLIKGIDLYKIETLCDVGTGAGFPGLVLKIMFPKIKITLVDSLQKRIKYLNLVIDELKLTEIETFHSRGEDFARDHRELYDVVTARAVARLSVIGEICIPMAKVGGYFIPMKANITDEIVTSKKMLHQTNAVVEDTIDFLLPIENSTRTLIIIKKIKETPSHYPRTIEIIKKNK